MTETHSRRAGPRREHVAAKQLIERNRAKIERIADHLSNGAFSASRRPKPERQPEGLVIHVLGGPSADETPRPYVRISPNDRVVLADHATGRQLEFLGEIRRENGARRFVLATKANGFFAEVAGETAARLAELDGATLDRTYGDARLTTDIRNRLGVA
jgi:hypothetical protein